MSVDRIANARLRDRVVSAEAAAALIQPGETVAMSGFTGSGYPKAVPVELARRIEAVHAQGNPFQIKLMTGASTAPELDGALAKADGIAMRMPFQSDRMRATASTRASWITSTSTSATLPSTCGSASTARSTPR